MFPPHFSLDFRSSPESQYFQEELPISTASIVLLFGPTDNIRTLVRDYGIPGLIQSYTALIQWKAPWKPGERISTPRVDFCSLPIFFLWSQNDHKNDQTCFLFRVILTMLKPMSFSGTYKNIGY